MDQFFVAVEMRDNPTLRDKPVAVGKTLITTANYEARKYGVRSAMPTFIGKKLCPHLVCIPNRFEAYSQASKQAQVIFSEYDPNFLAMSLDEAYLDITHHLNGLRLDSEEGIELAQKIVQEMRKKVFEITGGLTCSAGIAPSKMLAKISSEKNKPNGQFALKADLDVLQHFLHALPVRKIPGIGKAAELTLKEAFNVNFVQDLWEKRYIINRTLTPALIDFYLRIPCLATDNITINSDVSKKNSSGFFAFREKDSEEEEFDRKSVSVERTFRATSDELALKQLLFTVCKELADDISEKNLFGRTLTLKLKTDQFEVKSKGETLKNVFGGNHISPEFIYLDSEEQKVNKQNSS